MAHDPLKVQRNEVAAAEANLATARKNLKSAAERQRLPTEGIFSETEFVLRSTAERWSYKAEQKGKDAAREEIIGMFNAMRDGNSPFAHLSRVNFSSLALVSDRSKTIAAETAQRILEAGELARRGGPDLPEPTGVAARILNVGKKLRGEAE